MDMESIEEIAKQTNTRSFIDHVFEFDTSTKNELLNICQYSVLSLAPVVGLNKLMKCYIPEADESKGSAEIVFEIIGQVVVLFIGMFYIHRIVTYVPIYSTQDYEKFNVHTIILVTLLIVSSLHTKLGEKSAILSERINRIWNGEESLVGSVNVEKKTKMSSPPKQVLQPNIHLPQSNPVEQVQMSQHQDQQQAALSNMPSQPAQDQGFYQNEIMAANDGFGSSFGSMF
jgi:hypothetical protein|uniref:Uncharacterized protein n=1 Tax=viral metagenome TaxID=1070528 RepID=A0A6C0JAQ2_9ZZZZ